MPQNPPSAPLSERLSNLRDDLQYHTGVALRDALRAAQSRVMLSTPFFWTGLGCAVFVVIMWFLKGLHPNPGERAGIAIVCGLFILASLAFFTAHAEIKIRERRHQPHGGDRHPAQ